MLRFVIGIILVKNMFLIETVVKYMVLIFFKKKAYELLVKYLMFRKYMDCTTAFCLFLFIFL